MDRLEGRINAIVGVLADRRPAPAGGEEIAAAAVEPVDQLELAVPFQHIPVAAGSDIEINTGRSRPKTQGWRAHPGASRPQQAQREEARKAFQAGALHALTPGRRRMAKRHTAISVLGPKKIKETRPRTIAKGHPQRCRIQTPAKDPHQVVPTTTRGQPKFAGFNCQRIKREAHSSK